MIWSHFLFALVVWALVVIGVFIVHVYMGATVGPGSVEAIVHGEVRPEWARHHHGAWAPRISSGQAPRLTSGQADEMSKRADPSR